MGKHIKNENFVVVQGFMVNELGLKGNDLLVYAIIYGFSQAEDQTFSGSLQYLADWTNSTKRGVMKNLKNLLELGLIEKKEKLINGVKFCEYYVTKFHGVWNKVPRGMEQSSTNNIDNNIEDNIDNNTKVLLGQSPQTYGNEKINNMFDEWKKRFGYRPKNCAGSRRAVYNMLRGKDKGEKWLLDTMDILLEAQKDKYAGKEVLGIANFMDLQKNYDKVWKWGSGKAMRNDKIKRSIDI